MSGSAPGSAPAVLVLACRRPEFTERLLRLLVSFGVHDIHVVVDGARNSSDDAGRVERTREVVHSFNLPQSHLWLRDVNLGDAKGVPEAIDWFFTARDRGIILEDDLLPDPSFLRFAAELLDVYQNDSRVAAIHGWSSQLRRPPHSYYFSRYSPGWGWATWASRWNDFDREARLWFDVDHERLLREIADGDESFVLYWSKVLRRVYVEGARNWDYRWQFTNFVLNRVTATASVNLVENTGFGEDAANTKSRLFFLLPASTMQFPLRHPPEVRADLRADRHAHRAVYLWQPWMRIRYRLAGL